MKTGLNFILAVITVSGIAVSCDDIEISGDLVENTTISCETECMGTNTRVKGDAHSGKYFSRMDSVSSFGYGQSYYIVDSLVNKNFIISLNGWMRSGQLNPEAQIAVTVNSGDSMLNWQSVYLNGRINIINQWINFKDEVLIEKKWTNLEGITIKIFGFYPNAKSTFDIDDLNITIKTMD